MAVLLTDSGRFCYTNAGHNPPLLLRASGAHEELAATGLPLGLLPVGEYQREERQLEPGDLVAIYTDGVTEAVNRDGEEYGLARLLNLNETQEGVLSLIFKVADDNSLLLLDLKDLRAMLQFVGDNAAQFKTQYGNVSSASIGAIQRGLLQIEEQGGDRFFGEPMLNIEDLMQTADGQGVINILAADRLMNNPRLYASFLLWPRAS